MYQRKKEDDDENGQDASSSYSVNSRSDIAFRNFEQMVHRNVEAFYRALQILL